MKKIAVLLPFLLASCQGIPAQTTLAACPLGGLDEMVFYTGAPAEGSVMDANTLEDGGKEWIFGSGAGNVYVRCLYEDGREEVQKLPASMQSCAVEYRTDGKISRVRCKVEA